MQTIDILSQNLDFFYVANIFFLISVAIRVRNINIRNIPVYRFRNHLAAIVAGFAFLEFLLFLRLYEAPLFVVSIMMSLGVIFMVFVILMIMKSYLSILLRFIILFITTIVLIALYFITNDAFVVFQLAFFAFTIGFYIAVIPLIKRANARLESNSRVYMYLLLFCFAGYLTFTIIQNGFSVAGNDGFFFSHLGDTNWGVVLSVRFVFVFLIGVIGGKLTQLQQGKTMVDHRLSRILSSYVYVTFILLSIALVYNSFMTTLTTKSFVELTSHDLEIGIIAIGEPNISTLTGQQEDENSINYKMLKKNLESMRRGVEGIFRIYILGVSPSGEFFYYINEGRDYIDFDEDTIVPGSHFDELTDDMVESVLNTHVTYIGPEFVNREVGSVMTLFRPIIREDGNVAVIATDISADRLVTSISTERIVFYGVILGVYILVSLTYGLGIRTANLSQEYMLSELKYKSMFDHSSNAILILKKEKIIDANPTSVKLLGLIKKELLRKSILDISYKTGSNLQSLEDLFNSYLGSVSREKEVTFEWVFKTKKEAPIYCDVRLISYDFLGEKFYQVLFRDMSAKKKAQDELKFQLDKLRKLNTLMVGRELKMIELKQRISELTKKNES